MRRRSFVHLALLLSCAGVLAATPRKVRSQQGQPRKPPVEIDFGGNQSVLDPKTNKMVLIGGAWFEVKTQKMRLASDRAVIAFTNGKAGDKNAVAEMKARGNVRVTVEYTPAGQTAPTKISGEGAEAAFTQKTETLTISTFDGEEKFVAVQKLLLTGNVKIASESGEQQMQMQGKEVALVSDKDGNVRFLGVESVIKYKGPQP